MFKRPFFWFGLLLGSFVSYDALSKPRQLTPLPASDHGYASIDEALIGWNDHGVITRISPPAQTLFGPQGEGLSRLCYPTGQTVPPGQLPHRLVLRSGVPAALTGYRYRQADGSACILDIRAYAQPQGGAAVIFRDMTALHRSRQKEEIAGKRRNVVRLLSQRLSGLTSMDAIGQSVVQSARALLEDPSDIQVRLYLSHSESQTLSRLASDPEDRPKRPKSSAEALPAVFAFNAQVPALWQLYIAQQPVYASVSELNEDRSVSAYALPLLFGRVVTGHLSLTSATESAFDDLDLRETIETVASIASLALAGPQASELAGSLAAQSACISALIRALSEGLEFDRWADFVTDHIRRTTGCAVCTLSLEKEGKLAAAGEAFHDDLLFPERMTPDDPALHGKAIQKAWRTQKAVHQRGIENPSFESGPWRAFAGKAGTHSVYALPLHSQRGVLTVYTEGEAFLPETQVKFLETAVALVSLSLKSATVSAVF